MAVTKIWRIKGRADKVIEYAANEDKTERRIFVSAINYSPAFAKDQFDTVKKRFSKEDGTVAFHAYQSFAPVEATPELAHEIGVELAKELWGDRFQVIVATHLNTDCLHNHMIINSISFKDGKRFHSTAASYRQMRETSDRLCREHGLSAQLCTKQKVLDHYSSRMEEAHKNLQAWRRIFKRRHRAESFQQWKRGAQSQDIGSFTSTWVTAPTSLPS